MIFTLRSISFNDGHCQLFFLFNKGSPQYLIIASFNNLLSNNRLKSGMKPNHSTLFFNNHIFIMNSMPVYILKKSLTEYTILVKYYQWKYSIINCNRQEKYPDQNNIRLYYSVSLLPIVTLIIREPGS